MSMARIPRRNILFVLLLLGLCAASTTYATWPREPARRQLYAERIPMVLDEWRGEKYEMDARVIEVLGTDDIVARTYFRAGEPSVDFLVVFAKHTRRATHPPEMCLKGEGWIMERLSTRVIPSAVLPDPFRQRGFTVRELMMTTPGSRKLVYYFYKSGRKYTHSYLREQINVALGRLTDPNASDALIRLITRMGPGGVEAAHDRLDEFVSVVLPEIDEYLP